ncbi:MAG TPA: tetratricopeptide repeat protein [Verrucomicrobiae bacterium]|nr:tetratricopeptide repeat protein [Verrucomicrobiae bacterium]
MRRPLVICLVLFAVTLGVYWPVRQHDFIYYDDPQFITENDQIKAGLTVSGVSYAFTRPVVGNWHPITTLSHMLDCQLFAVNPGAHHLMNAAIHAVNAALVFLLLFQMTGSTWRSVAVAALFALHPLRLESVAWASERKDVLCAFFGLLCLMAYARYASRVTCQVSGKACVRARLWYAASLLLLALGLMSKAMLVTWPFVMLLLDVWPLQRFGLSTLNSQRLTLRHLLLEKVPFLALCLVVCVITLIVQQEAGAVADMNKVAITDRIVNAVMSYVRYLGHAIWPAKLAVIYPHPAVFYATAERWPGWAIGVAAVALVAVSVLCVRTLRARPYLAVGWFWYLGTLVPVLGLVQVGEQALADRYTYLPLIGPAIAVVWALTAATEKLSFQRQLCFGLGTAVAVACVVLTREQLAYWRNTVTLFERTLQVTSANPSAHFALGTGLESSGNIEQAIREYEAAVAINPRYKKAHYNLGQTFRKQQRWREAAVHYRAVLEVDSKDVPSHLNLAAVLSAQGQTRDAILHYNRALRLDPGSVEALNNLAWIHATCPVAEFRDGTKAVQFGLRACELSSNSVPTVVGTLAAAYAEAGKFAEAIKTAEQARDLASRQGLADVARRNQGLIELYRAGKAYHEPRP